jgi:hypothetical protein
MLPYQFNGKNRKRFESEDCGYKTECWVWKPQLSNYGRPYFKIGYGKKKLNAYRWMYEKIIEPIPDGFVLHHKCQNKVCVNPYHLEPKTASQHQSDHARGRKLNLSDKERLRRKTVKQGEKCNLSKLTEAQVIEMRRLRSEENMKLLDLAHMFSCSKSLVSMICLRKVWTHI